MGTDKVYYRQWLRHLWLDGSLFAHGFPAESHLRVLSGHGPLFLSVRLSLAPSGALSLSQKLPLETNSEHGRSRPVECRGNSVPGEGNSTGKAQEGKRVG